MTNKDIFNEVPGLHVIPLFDGLKTPNFRGWKDANWEQHAIKWLNDGHVVSGRFIYMHDDCPFVVLDPEGKAWPDVKQSAFPAWLRMARHLNELLPAWVSAGGDGGHNIMNVLLPISHRDLVDICGIPVNARHQLPRAYSSSSSGAKGAGELLTRLGVCVPRSYIRDKARMITFHNERDWHWEDALAAWESIKQHVLDILVPAIIEGASITHVGDNRGGNQPTYRDITSALLYSDPPRAAAVTKQIIEDGGSRHYAAKSWANYAYVSLQVDDVKVLRIKQALTVDWRAVDEYSERIIDLVLDYWGNAVGFSRDEISKAVYDERRFVFK